MAHLSRHRAAALGPFPAADVYDIDFTKAGAATALSNAGFTEHRATTAWDDSFNSFATGVPVITSARGLYCNEARTNSLLNSTAPVTQTVSLVAGTYVCWINGSGSVTLSGGPVNVVTAASPGSFTLAGTTSVTFTVSGSVTYFEVSLGTFATLPIVTAGSAFARDLDSVSASRSAISQGTVAIKTRTPLGNGSFVQAAWQIDDGTSNNLWRVARSTAGILNMQRTSGGSTITQAASALTADADRTLVMAWQDGDCFIVTSTGATTNGSMSNPASLPTTERIGISTSAANCWNRSIYRIARWVTRQPNATCTAIANNF